VFWYTRVVTNVRGGARNDKRSGQQQQKPPFAPSESLAASSFPPPPNNTPLEGDIEAPQSPLTNALNSMVDQLPSSTSDSSTIPSDLNNNNNNDNNSITSNEAAAVSATVSTNLLTGLGPNARPPGWLRRKFPTFPWHRLPNMLTYARCAAIPGLMALFYAPGRHVESGILFALASLTDWLDGYLARTWDIASPFGAFLDPVADKLTVSTALLLLSGWYGALVVIPSIIIIAREIAVSALREWMAQRGQRDAVQVGIQGKLKTALTMVALTMLLLVPTSGEGKVLAFLEMPGLVLLYLSAVLTVTSGSAYFRAAAPMLLS
jgi:CDP-diacylglycerol--glycerol-3-phosphate 3-phosphatidyltransferase